MAKFRTGDIFAFKLPSNEYISGRIMLDVKQQCIRPKLLKADSLLGFFNGSLLVEVYKETSQIPIASRSDVLIPGIFIDSHSLKSGDWIIVGHEDVDPTEVEFPEALLNQGRHPRFVKGEISLQISLSSEDLDRLHLYRTIEPSSILGDICLYYLGRPEEINNPRLQDIELRSLKHCDLRFTEYRSEIYQLLCEDENQSYYEMSTRLGYDIRRFYPTHERLPAEDTLGAGEAGVIILCPYCLSPVDENTKLCPTCGEDTTCDALIEMEPEEYRNKERKTCRFCRSPMLKLAPLCPSCRRWQTPRTASQK